MDINTIMQWIQLGTEHKWLLLAIAVIGWLTSLTSDWSKFPITIPSRWQPAVTAVLGFAYGVLQKVSDGQTWRQAIVNGLLVGLATGGLYDLVINGIFDGKVPSWLAWLAFAKKPAPANDNGDPPKQAAA